jgi:tripartite-type tricarboxylate transporter receptor subunit TctC
LPKDRVDRYAAAILEIMREPDTQKKFLDAKMSPVTGTRTQTEPMLKAYRAQWAPAVQKSGYQP